jgi:hypothetical protein
MTEGTLLYIWLEAMVIPVSLLLLLIEKQKKVGEEIGYISNEVNRGGSGTEGLSKAPKQ